MTSAARTPARFLNHLVTNDVARLYPGRVLYSPMCYPTGGVVDDLLVYLRGPEDYFLCINAGNIDKDLAWIREQAAGFNVAVTDRSPDYAQLAVQGPQAPAIVQSLTASKLDRVKYYHFTEGAVAGVPCLISRTGYTGEDGFELYHRRGRRPASGRGGAGSRGDRRARTGRVSARATACALKRVIRSTGTRSRRTSRR